jgi:hypothetical protein
MKIEIPILASLFLIGTSLLARVAVQGIEQALLATVAEYGANGLRGLMTQRRRVWWAGRDH